MADMLQLQDASDPRQPAPARSSVAIEGERKGTYPDGRLPRLGAPAPATATTSSTWRGGYLVTLSGDERLRYDDPRLRHGDDPPRARAASSSTLPDGPVPDWINAARNRVAITTPEGRG